MATPVIMDDQIDLKTLLINLNHKIDYIVSKIDSLRDRVEQLNSVSAHNIEYDPSTPAMAPQINPMRATMIVAPTERGTSTNIGTNNLRKPSKRKYTKKSFYWEDRRKAAALNKTSDTPYFSDESLPSLDPALFIRQ